MTAGTVPYTFAANTTIVSAQVNANFAALVTDLNGIDAGQITTGTLATARLPTIPGAKLPTRATFNGNPADPTGTASLTKLMAGMGGTAKITPLTTGTVVFCLQFIGLSTSSFGCAFQLWYGSGAAPANGDATTGTNIGLDQAAVAGAGGMPFNLLGVATGLTVGVSYWFDVSQVAVIGGTASLTRVNATAFELN